MDLARAFADLDGMILERKEAFVLGADQVGRRHRNVDSETAGRIRKYFEGGGGFRLAVRP